MYLYQETKTGARSSYRKLEVDENGKVLSSRSVDIVLYEETVDDFTYILLYDSNMEVISDAFAFLNHDIAYSPFTTRKKNAYALRLLYSFLGLWNYTAADLDSALLTDLIMFMRGLSSPLESLKAVSERNPDTVNGYLSAYRKFYKARGIECAPLFDQKVTQGLALSKEWETRAEITQASYTANLKTKDRSQELPKYISPGEFRILYSNAISEGDAEGAVLMHLMYAYGFRIGELLGISTEDISEKRVNGTLVPVLTLRNRISDKRFQYAKGIPHPANRDFYRTKEYAGDAVDIVISYEMYEQLVDFVNTSHVELALKYPANYATTSADIVSRRDAPDENHYVFLNRYGRVLSAQTWGEALKKKFEQAGIPTEFDVSGNNLSHRFRHGFAMWHARFSPKPVNALELKKLMRHKSITSTMVYYNPTLEDELEIKQGFQDDLYTLIPELGVPLYADI